MATVTRIRSIPPLSRSYQMDDVAAGDKINIEDILGRPARGLKFVLATDTDEVEYRLNNRLVLPRSSLDTDDNVAVDSWGVKSTDVVWSRASKYPVFTATGALEIETMQGLQINSIEIVDLTLGSGTTITVVVW